MPGAGRKRALEHYECDSIRRPNTAKLPGPPVEPAQLDFSEAPITSANRQILPPSSLIIPSRNRPKMLEEAVESVLQGEELPAELIIVDQSDVPHPSLQICATASGCDIRYLWSHSVGSSRARNQGIAEAEHDILVFTDDDVRVMPTWFGTLLGALLQNGSRSVVTGQAPPSEENPGGFQLAIQVDQHSAVYEGRIGRDVLCPFNMAMYRSAIDEVGNFDVRLGPGTSFPAAEDIDFGFRLLEAGYRIVYVPEAVVYHRAWRTERHYLPLRWSYGVGQGAFYAKHLSLRDRYILGRMWRDIRRRLWRLPRRLSRRDRRGLLSDAVPVAGLLHGAVRWILTQRKMR